MQFAAVAGKALLLVLIGSSASHAADRAPRGLVRIGAPTGTVALRHEAGGETRTAIAVPIGSDALRFDLGSTAPGRIEVSGAPGKAGSLRLRARVETNLGPARVRHNALYGCEVSWDAKDAPAWRGCRIDLPSSYEGVRLVVDAEGSPGTVYVATPDLVEPRENRDGPTFFFLLDTLRADALRVYGASAMPGEAMSRLARDSWVYMRARSTSGWTRPAIATLLTGARAATHGVYSRFDSLGESLPVLPEVMSGAGYRTIALSSNPNVLERWGFGRGFDRFVDVGAANWTTEKTDANELFDLLERQLQQDEGLASFYYVHFMDPHFPYRPDPADRAAMSETAALRAAFPPGPQPPSERVWNEWLDYLAEVRGLDRRFGRFLALLQTLGLYETSTIVLVSDHGEEFLDHGRQYHGQTLFEEMLWVPLLIKPRGPSSAAARIDRPVGLQDVAPTILASLGMDAPPWPDGRPVLPTSPAVAGVHLAELRLDAFSLAAAIQENWKVIVDHNGGATNLYDLSSDPHEQTTTSTDAARMASLRELLRDEYSRGEPGWHFRACGNASATSFEFFIDGAPAAPERFGLETEDELEAVDDAWRARLRLAARSGQRELQGKFVDVVLPDADELTVAAGGKRPTALRLRSPAGAPMAVAFGSSQILANEKSVTLAEREVEATIKPGDLPVCGPAGFRGATPSDDHPPYLRIWYLPANDETPPPPDANLDERLRALGYLQ